MQPSIAHIVNPVKVNGTSDLFVAQPVTFETMRVAQALCSKVCQVELLTTQFEEDKSIIPSHFTILPDLTRSVLDIHPFQASRKLPLIRDILSKLSENSAAGYYIYTNVDIALMPYFYQTVSHYINKGFDALIINRRTIPGFYKDIAELPLMYAEAGKSHRGFDCFIFKAELLDKFMLGNVCIGANHVGKALLLNLAVFARNFKIFTDQHLTFHIGNDQNWKMKKYSDYDNFNALEVIRIIDQLRAREDVIRDPQKKEFIYKYLKNTVQFSSLEKDQLPKFVKEAATSWNNENSRSNPLKRVFKSLFTRS